MAIVTMNAVKTANINKTSSQLQMVVAWKLPKPIWFIMPSTAAVIPLESSQGRNTARKNSKNNPPMNAVISVAADTTSNSRPPSPSGRRTSRVMMLTAGSHTEQATR